MWDSNAKPSPEVRGQGSVLTHRVAQWIGGDLSSPPMALMSAPFCRKKETTGMRLLMAAQCSTVMFSSSPLFRSTPPFSTSSRHLGVWHAHYACANKMCTCVCVCIVCMCVYACMHACVYVHIACMYVHGCVRELGCKGCMYQWSCDHVYVHVYRKRLQC